VAVAYCANLKPSLRAHRRRPPFCEGRFLPARWWRTNSNLWLQYKGIAMLKNQLLLYTVWVLLCGSCQTQEKAIENAPLFIYIYTIYTLLAVIWCNLFNLAQVIFEYLTFCSYIAGGMLATVHSYRYLSGS